MPVRGGTVKLEFLPSGSADCPLIRLYNFSLAEARQLHALVSALASAETERVDLHNLPFVEAINGCRLTLVVRAWDQAVIRVGGPADFECGFRSGSWDNVAGLLEPFTETVRGYQWLAGSPGEASLLLSASGQW